MAEPKSIRPLVNFPAGIVTDHFLSDSSHSVNETKYEEEHQRLKEEVNKMLVGAFDKPWTKLDLIDAVQRLGVSYHFEKMIDELLQQMHADAKDNEEFLNLYDTSLGFRLLRQHGHKISCDMFKKFKDDEDKFKESLKSDVGGMLSLYEATHLRIHGEDILDEALAFTTNHLQMILQSDQNLISHSVSDQIRHALSLPLHKNVPRLEAKYYMSVYEQDSSHSEILLTFAKLDFNILQKLHQKELCNISGWWKELDVSKKLPFARDRITESYFWIVGMYFEPEYFLDRKIFTKVIALISLVDDIYDAYGTRQELELLTQAIDRWDINAANDLPECLKVFYEEVFLRINKEIEQDLIAHGISYRMHYAQQVQKALARAYMEEAKWVHEKKIPTMEEFMQVGLITSTIPLLSVISLLGLGNFATKDVFDWVLNYPKLVTASSIIYRFIDDIITHEYEKETRGQEVTSVQCYMKQHGVTKQEAIDELYRQISNAWKDINEECLRPFTVPFPVLKRIIGLVRVASVVYKDGDGYTFSQLLLKDDIASLLVHPLSVFVSDI